MIQNPIVENENALAVRKSSCSTQSTSTQIHSDIELSPRISIPKKQRTVTFAEIDVSELDYQASKVPIEQRRQWKRQAIQRRIEQKRYHREMKMLCLKGCVIFLLLMICSFIILLATAQGAHVKLQDVFSGSGQ